MRQVKGQRGTKRLVWRMDALHPAGAFLDPDEAPGPAPQQTESARAGWLDSSLALLDGLQVSEMPLDSMPGEFYDDFCKDRL